MGYEFCLTAFISGRAKLPYISWAKPVESMSDEQALKELIWNATEELSKLETKIKLESTVGSETTVVTTVLNKLSKLSTEPETAADKQLLLSFHQQRLSEYFKICDTSRRQVIQFVMDAAKNIFEITKKVLSKIKADSLNETEQKDIKKIKDTVKPTDIRVLHNTMLITNEYHKKALTSLKNAAKNLEEASITLATQLGHSSCVDSFKKQLSTTVTEVENDKQLEEKFNKEGNDIRKMISDSATRESELRIALKVMEGTVSDIIDNNYRLDLKKCSHEGFLHCSECNKEFSYPTEEKLHPGHHYYETLIASLHYKKAKILEETRDVVKELSRYKLEGCIPDSKEFLEKCESKLRKCNIGCSPKQNCVRIASWNIHRLSDQSENQDLFIKRLRCICRTILYYEVDVIALQEVCSCEILEQMMIQTLNSYSCLKWESKKQKIDREHFFFVYKEKRFKTVESLKIITLQRISLETSTKGTPAKDSSTKVASKKGASTKGAPKKGDSAKGASAIAASNKGASTKDAATDGASPKGVFLKMKVNDNTLLTIINTHLTYTKIEERKKELASLTTITQLHECQSILLGDFNTGPKDLSVNLEKKYHCIFEEDEKTNTLQTECYDNIVVSATHKDKVHNHFVGSIITCGELTEEKVSDHLPIIADLEFR